MMSDQHSESKSDGCNSNGNNNNNNSNSSNGNTTTTTVISSINNTDSILFYLPVDEIVEDNEYSTLIPPITKEEYESLKNDIQQRGIQLPLVINSKHILLDGYTRLRIAKELGLQSVPCIIRDKKKEDNEKKEEEEGDRGTPLCDKDVVERLEEELFIISVNANRRHLNTAQKVELALKLMEIMVEVGKRKRLSNLNNNNDNNNSISLDSYPRKESRIKSTMTNIGHDTWAYVRKEFRLSPKTLVKGKRIKEVASRDKKIAEYWNEALQGKRSIKSVYEKVKEVEAREKIRPIVEEAKERLGNSLGLSPSSTPTTVTSSITLLHGDFRDVLKDIPDNSIDLIFTDPPYSEVCLELIRDLALLASRILKPSGFLAIMYGQGYLPKVFQNLNVTGLKYYWTIALHMPESKEMFFERNVEVCWKPIIIYQKEPLIRVERRFKDHISEPRPDKDIHEWRQDIGSALHVIKSLTEGEDDIVLDPMAGTGVTVEACLMLKRRCIAVEKDKDMYELLRNRFT